MATGEFKNGSASDRIYKALLDSTLQLLIEADKFGQFVSVSGASGSTSFTKDGQEALDKMREGAWHIANAVGQAVDGEDERKQVGPDDYILFIDKNTFKKYRVPFKTLSNLVVISAIQSAAAGEKGSVADILGGDASVGGDGGSVAANIWAKLAGDSSYQIDASHLRDALADYLTKSDLQGLFRDQGSDAYISKIQDDEVLGFLTFLSGFKCVGIGSFMKGFTIGNYQTGITGSGASVDGMGNGEFESLIVRRFLEVPELRYNRVEVLAGDNWRAPGGGVIESVQANPDGTGTVVLKLEEGEIGNIAVDDICMGIFHDYYNPGVNETQTTDDGFGNRTFAGFFTAYFRITSVTDLTFVDGIPYYNKIFTYALRPVGGRWTKSMHPCPMMDFVVYGNFTDKTRQHCTYTTTSYVRMLRGQNDWEFKFENIGMQYGDNSILANFDTSAEPNPRAQEASKYLFYIDGDIMHTGIITKVDPHGRDVIDYYDQGVWDPNIEYFYKDRVFHNGSMWLLVREDVVDEEGIHGLIGDEPSNDNPNWLAVVYADTMVSRGHWEAEKCPYPALSIVSLGGVLYMSNKATSNPPKGLLLSAESTDENREYLKTKENAYIIVDDSMTDDWGLLFDPQQAFNGEDAVYINLTNDSDTVETDENGIIPLGYEYPTTKAQLYKGAVQVRSGITWSVTAVGCQATIAPESGTVVPQNMTEDRAVITVIAIYENISYTKQFKLTKLYGMDRYVLQPSHDVVQYDPNFNNGQGKFTPEQITMRAFVLRKGSMMEMTADAALGYIELKGVHYYSGMTVDTSSMQPFTNGRLSFSLYDNADEPRLVDYEEIPLVMDGIDGEGAVTMQLTNDTDTIMTDSDGNVDETDPDVYPTTTAELYFNLDKINPGEVTWSAVGDGCTASIDDNGTVTTSQMTKDKAVVLIIAAYGGRQYSKTFTFTKLFGTEKYYLQCSHNVIVRQKNGNFTPISIVMRAFVKRFGEAPVECTAQTNLAKIVYAGQSEPQFSPVSVVIRGDTFTDRHLVFSLVGNDTSILDVEDIPLIWDGEDGADGEDGKDGKSFNHRGNWRSDVEYNYGDVVRLGDEMYMCKQDGTTVPPRALLIDQLDGKYIVQNNGGYLICGEQDTYNWEFYIRDGRDGIDGIDGQDGRDGQDGETPVFINLTNDTDSVVTDQAGTPIGDLPTTTAQFFYGTRQLTSSDGVEWGTEHVVGCTIDFDQNGNYRVLKMSADRAQVTIKATYKGNYYIRLFNFSKLYGQDKYVLELNYGTVQHNPLTGTYTPSKLEVHAYVVKNGNSQTITQASDLGYIMYDGNANKVYSGAEVNTSDYFRNGGVEFRLYKPDGTVVDKEYVPRLSDGKDGAPGNDSVLAWFDDQNIHFLCDAEGRPVGSQSYTTNGRVYGGQNPMRLASASIVSGNDKVTCSIAIGGSGNTEAILTVSGFTGSATDANTIQVKLKTVEGGYERLVNIKVDKVRPGKDGESPVVWTIVPTVNIMKKLRQGGFNPSQFTVNVRKSWTGTGVVHNDVMTVAQAEAIDGVQVYYAFDQMITEYTQGTKLSGNVTPPNTCMSFISMLMVNRSMAVIDKQTIGILTDGTGIVMRGHWKSGEDYGIGDIILFENCWYRCLTACANIAPRALLTDRYGYFLKNRDGGYISYGNAPYNTEYWIKEMEFSDDTRYWIDVTPDTLVATAGGEWPNNETITVKAWKQTGFNAPVPVVTGDAFCFYMADYGTPVPIGLSGGVGTFQKSSLRAGTNSVVVYITKDGSTDGSRNSAWLDSVTIGVVKNGARGYNGCQTRVTKWVDAADSSEYRVLFKNDRDNNDMTFKVVDIIGVPWKPGIVNIEGQPVTVRPSSGYLWYAYQGTSGRKQEMTWELERTRHRYDWEAMSDAGAMFTSIIVAQYGRIEFETTNELLVDNSRNQVVAGMTGGINTENEDDSIRIWAGMSLPTEGWLTYVPGYSYGRYLWGMLQIRYGAYSSTAITLNIMNTVLATVGQPYTSVAVEYCNQGSSVDTYPTAGWSGSWSRGNSGQHTWVRMIVYNGGTHVNTYYLRIRYRADYVWGITPHYSSSVRQGSEPSLAPFRVTQAGNIYAESAWIRGHVEALTGHIGGFSITNEQLYSDSTDYLGLANIRLNGSTGKARFGAVYLNHTNGIVVRPYGGNSDSFITGNLWEGGYLRTGYITISSSVIMDQIASYQFTSDDYSSYTTTVNSTRGYIYLDFNGNDSTIYGAKFSATGNKPVSINELYTGGERSYTYEHGKMSFVGAVLRMSHAKNGRGYIETINIDGHNYFQITVMDGNGENGMRMTSVGLQKYANGSWSDIDLGGGGGSTTVSWSNVTGILTDSEEFNFVDMYAGKSTIYMNWRAKGTTEGVYTKITQYTFCNGQKDSTGSGVKIRAGSFDSTSDENLKDIVENFTLSLKDIADAPLVKFTWKDKNDDRINVGSIAQYWNNILPEAVDMGEDGTLSMDYSKLALSSAISLAREVQKLRKEIERLKNNNRKLG